MTTLANFVSQYNKGLASALSEQFGLNVEEVTAFIKGYKHGDAKSPKPKKAAAKPKVEDEEPASFVPFGKFVSHKKMVTGVKAAVDKGKYRNANTGSLHGDTAAMKKKFVFYDSGVAGVEGSDELEKMLGYFPGNLVVSEPVTPPSSPKKSKKIPAAPVKAKPESVIAEKTDDEDDFSFTPSSKDPVASSGDDDLLESDTENI